MKISKFKQTSPKNSRLPSEVFNHCPQCDSHNIYKFEGEVFCFAAGCDWNSVAVHAECQPLGFGSFKKTRSTTRSASHQSVDKQDSESDLVVA